MQEMKYLSFSDAKGDFIRIGIELATNAQRDTFAENPMKVRFEIGIQKRCDIQFDLVQFFYSCNVRPPNMEGFPWYSNG